MKRNTDGWLFHRVRGARRGAPQQHAFNGAVIQMGRHSHRGRPEVVWPAGVAPSQVVRATHMLELAPVPNAGVVQSEVRDRISARKRVAGERI